jgi:hypothetical protein
MDPEMQFESAASPSMPSHDDRIISGLVQPAALPTFGGEEGESVNDFVETFKEISSMARWSPEICKSRLPLVLRSHALKWYRSSNRSQQKIDSILQDIIREFSPMYSEFITQRMLLSRSQGPLETVAVYANTMRDLIRRADTNRTMAEEQKIFYFLNGLNPNIRTNVMTIMQLGSAAQVTPMSPTLDDVIMKARTAEIPIVGQSHRASTSSNPTYVSEGNILFTNPIAVNEVNSICATEVVQDEVYQLREDMERLIGEVQTMRQTRPPRSTPRPPPNKPCPICNTPDALHWMSQCPRVLEAKALHLQANTKKTSPNGTGSTPTH